MIRLFWNKLFKRLLSHKSFYKKIYVSRRPPYNLSLFASGVLEKGEVVFSIEGTPTKRTSNITIPFDEVWKVDPLSTNNPAKYLNHSCEPNCGISVVDTLHLVARCDIKSHEEVTIDYATLGYDFGDEWPRSKRSCACGSVYCRGTVTGWKELPKSKKEEYIKDGIVLGFLLKPEYNKGDGYSK